MKPKRIKQPWHKGSYDQQSRRLVKWAYTQPNLRCWKCGLLITQSKHKNGKPARWTAGHKNRAEINGPLIPECSPCMAHEGATLGAQTTNAKHKNHKRKRTQPIRNRWTHDDF